MIARALPQDYSETEADVLAYATQLGLTSAAGDKRIDGEERPSPGFAVTDA